MKPPPLGGSNEYPQSLFLSRNKKNNVYSCKRQFYSFFFFLFFLRCSYIFVVLLFSFWQQGVRLSAADSVAKMIQTSICTIKHDFFRIKTKHMKLDF